MRLPGRIPRLDNGKLIASKPGNGILGANQLQQPFRHSLEQIITGGMAKRIVYRLEFVEIDHVHSKLTATRECVADFLAQTLFELKAISQSCQRIMQGDFSTRWRCR